MKRQEVVMGRTVLQAFVALLLAPAMAVAQPAFAPALRDGVVVDAASGTAFVMSPAGGIDAIDLATGASRWKTDAAAKPLVVTGDTLVAQAAPSGDEQLAIVSLNKGDGATKRRTDVALPKELKARVTDTPSEKTLVRGLLASGGEVVVAWVIESRLARGAVSDGAVIEQESGAARIDPATGASAALAAGAADAANDAVSGLTIAEMSQLRSVDGQHVVRSERSSDARNLRAPYRWTISTTAGEGVGVVDSPIALAPFMVSGSQILYVAPPAGYRDGDRFVTEPLRLRAIDVRSGAELWAVPVLDASFVLPPP